MPPQFLIVALIVFLAILTHSMIGFGVALISMPLLITVLDPARAAAFVAIFTIPLQIVVIWRYRHALNVRPIWRAILGTAVGIPVGVLLIAQLDQHVILAALGLSLVAYALYSLLDLRLPDIRRPAWGFGFGFASGVLSGAYNTGGPPMVIYGTSLGWKPEQFKANLQLLFLIADPLVVGAHLIAGHIDALVLENLLVALPMIIVGTAAGFWLSRFVNEALFRKIVLIGLLVVGVRLLLP